MAEREAAREHDERQKQLGYGHRLGLPRAHIFMEALVEGVQELAALDLQDMAGELERLEKLCAWLSIGNPETVSVLCP